MTGPYFCRQGLAATAGLLLLLAGCAPGGEVRTESSSIDRGRAESVRAEIKMAAGELRVSGGAQKLLEAEFTYNARGWRPQIHYDETGFRGRLSVRQPPTAMVFQTGNVRNEWDLRLNNEVPLNLGVRLGAGESHLELAHLNLRSLDLEMGAGELVVDLRGNWEKDLDVRIRGGVGEVTIRLPRDVGVTAEARGGIGEIRVRGLEKRGGRYVNESYGDSKATMHLDIKGGIGQINLIAEQYPRAGWAPGDYTVATGRDPDTSQERLPSALAGREGAEIMRLSRTADSSWDSATSTPLAVIM